MPVVMPPPEIAESVDLQDEAPIVRARAELEKRGQSADRYKVAVMNEDRILTVLFEARDTPERMLGSGGSVPGFAVEFDAATKQLLKAYFVR